MLSKKGRSKRMTKSKKVKKEKKHNNRKTQKKHSRKSNRRRRLSKRRRGGDLPSNQQPQKPNEEMLIDPQDVGVEEVDVGQEVNAAITRILDSGTIDQNSRPETVYNIMTQMLDIWNYVNDEYRDGVLTEENVNHTRTLMNSIYDHVVRVIPQDSAIIQQDGEELLPEIINIRSSAILNDLFDYVANIHSDDVENRINDAVEIPDYDAVYGQIPDEDNPDFESDDDESVVEMDDSQ